VIVRLHKTQLDYFRRKARHNPNEIYAELLGNVISSKLIVVHKIAYPALDESTPSGLTVNVQSIEDILDDAKDNDWVSVGGIHSHPNWSPVLSETDHKQFTVHGHKLVAIVEVTGRKTRVVFWQDGTPLPCEIEYF
jgi:proteasome lid subunit RPN8/RPN11